MIGEGEADGEPTRDRRDRDDLRAVGNVRIGAESLLQQVRNSVAVGVGEGVGCGEVGVITWRVNNTGEESLKTDRRAPAMPIPSGWGRTRNGASNATPPLTAVTSVGSATPQLRFVDPTAVHTSHVDAMPFGVAGEFRPHVVGLGHLENFEPGVHNRLGGFRRIRGDGSANRNVHADLVGDFLDEPEPVSIRSVGKCCPAT